MQLKASAPGSLMLLGEFAVLHGKPALVCAVDKRITVTLTPRKDNRIEIISSLGKYSTDLDKLEIVKPFQFILAILKKFQNELLTGCNITIESQFSDKIGFGSSAATTVATLSAITTWKNMPFSPFELLQHGQDIVRQVQGVGSGADIAASIFGGVMSYTADFSELEKIPVTLPLHAIYSGYKTPTAEVIHHVNNSIDQSTYQKICNEIGLCAADAKEYVQDKNWEKLGEIMDMQQTHMQSLGVSSELLENIVDDLRKQPKIFGAKISGSGMGDCVIGLGDLAESYDYQKLQRIPVQTSLQGVSCEKI